MSEPIDTEELRGTAAWMVEVGKYGGPDLAACADEIDRLRLALTAALSASPAEPESTAFVMSEDDRFHVWSKLEAIRRETESGRFGTPGQHITLDHVYEEATTAQALVTYDANRVGASPAEPVERDDDDRQWIDGSLRRAATAVRNLIKTHPSGAWASWVATDLERLADREPSIPRLAARPVPVPAAPTDEPPKLISRARYAEWLGLPAPAAPDPDTTP